MLSATSHRVFPLLLALLGAPAVAQTLVRDIATAQPQATPSDPGPFHSGPVMTFFAARGRTANQAYGTELYGAAAGTALLVKDIHPGSGNSFPDGFCTAGGVTYFAASDGRNGRELWRTDGTSAGTTMVRDIVAGPGSSNPSRLVAIGSTVYFFLGQVSGSAPTSMGPEVGELWRSDGTAAGTVRVRKFRTGVGPDGIEAARMVAVGSRLFIVADDGQRGFELWRSDGTTAGTVFVRDIYVGPVSSNIRWLTPYRGGVLFHARSGGASNYELWTSDGTTAGTNVVLELQAGTTGSLPRFLTVFGNFVYFSANGGNGFELYRTDGTAAGTVEILDIRPGPGSSSPFNSNANVRDARFAIMGNAFYFGASDAAFGRELWRSDGTRAGTVRVLDIAPGAVSSVPSEIVVDGARIFFAAFDSAGSELWLSDGTAAGSMRVKDIHATPFASSSPTGLVRSPLGGVVFRADDGVHGAEPWFSDGTTAGTRLLLDVNTAGSGDTVGADVRNLVDVNGTFFFTADDGVRGAELWKSDGTAAGTVLVRDIQPGAVGSNPDHLTAMNGYVYFAAADNATNVELWRSDGTAAGTVKVREIYLGFQGSQPRELIAVNGTLFFAARSLSTGNYELWKSDGTTAGTVMVADIYAGTVGSNPRDFAVLNGVLYFSARSGTTQNYEPWQSDGTAVGTIQLLDIQPGPTGSFPRSFVVAGDRLFFSAQGRGSGQELWVSDGTPSGTALVRDLLVGAGGSEPQFLTPLGNRVIFAASDGATPPARGRELWISDGTAGGTQLVADIHSGVSVGVAQSSDPSNVYGGAGEIRRFAVSGGRVYFRANDGMGGNNSELWASDGTAAGTVMVAEINANGPAEPWSITPVGSRHIVFRASDGTAGEGMGTGAELWLSDGTAAGTRRLADIHPGDHDAQPRGMVLSGGRLFFAADDGRRGVELHVFDPGATSQPIGHPCPGTAAPVLAASDPVLGAAIELRAVRGGAGTLGFLIAGLRRNPLQTGLGAGCHLYVDLGAALISPFVPGATGEWTARLTVPNNPAQIGAEVMLQAALGPTQQPPLGLDLTGAVKLTLGR